MNTLPPSDVPFPSFPTRETAGLGLFCPLTPIAHRKWMPNGHFAQLLLLALRGRDRSPLQEGEFMAKWRIWLWPSGFVGKLALPSANSLTCVQRGGHVGKLINASFRITTCKHSDISLVEIDYTRKNSVAVSLLSHICL